MMKRVFFLLLLLLFISKSKEANRAEHLLMPLDLVRDGKGRKDELEKRDKMIR